MVEILKVVDECCRDLSPLGVAVRPIVSDTPTEWAVPSMFEVVGVVARRSVEAALLQLELEFGTLGGRRAEGAGIVFVECKFV